ncbi:hypothetical protein BDN70DRAFT_901898 [Pholiota conissans]|uniref:Uncharacterized protein n=1 Tax=Pholiota conissans TaxID=109636 RepID=A0A9P6CLI7_9AGAR|nr:hypothetical protein BDN70DRAFT_901898 [Pholiota conissans]
MSTSATSDGSISDEEYWSAEEEPFVQLSHETLQIFNSSRITPEEEVYWANVPEFDYDDEDFVSAVSGLAVSPQSVRAVLDPAASSLGVQQNVAHSDPSTSNIHSGQGNPQSHVASSRRWRPASDPSPESLPRLDTSQSHAAHPFHSNQRSRKTRCWVVTKGRYIGVFDNW